MSQGQSPLNTVQRHGEVLGNLTRRGGASKCHGQRFTALGHLPGTFVHIFGDTNEGSLFEYGTTDRLFDPPDRIGTELQITPVIKFLHRTHEPNVAFLNKVGQRQTGVRKLTGRTGEEGKVMGREFLFGTLDASLETMEGMPDALQSPQTIAKC